MRQGYRTIQFPKGKPPELPDRFRGRPVFQTGKCKAGCTVCVDICPVGAISGGGMLSIDLGKCLFCTDCERACLEHAISFQNDYRLSVRSREDLILSDKDTTMRLACELDASMKRLFGRSLKLRQVSAGGCNACEADVNVLGTIGWDLGRFGIQFVASPRHADGLLITGPVTKNMELALKKAYDAVPDPKIVIAVGACAISGGPYSGHPEANDGVLSMLPVDLFIPGCPPHPLTILDGLLRLLGKIDDTRIKRS
jgi:Ni,Fe-hydrogenase III small subunit/NAD-dependent dihydropyrimidine dehydrogenase PreA subunit